MAWACIDYIGTGIHNSYEVDGHRVDADEEMTEEVSSLQDVLIRNPNTLTVEIGYDSSGRDQTVTYDTSTNQGVANYVRDTLITSRLDKAESSALSRGVPETAGPRTADSDATLFAELNQSKEEYLSQLPDRTMANTSRWTDELFIGGSALLLLGIGLRRITRFRNQRLIKKYDNARDSLRNNQLAPEGSNAYYAIQEKEWIGEPPLNGGFRARAKARTRVNKVLG